eukprot:10500324-Karenia_brevis.AAC.1
MWAPRGLRISMPSWCTKACSLYAPSQDPSSGNHLGPLDAHGRDDVGSKGGRITMPSWCTKACSLYTPSQDPSGNHMGPLDAHGRDDVGSKGGAPGPISSLAKGTPHTSADDYA